MSHVVSHFFPPSESPKEACHCSSKTSTPSNLYPTPDSVTGIFPSSWCSEPAALSRQYFQVHMCSIRCLCSDTVGIKVYMFGKFQTEHQGCKGYVAVGNLRMPCGAVHFPQAKPRAHCLVSPTSCSSARVRRILPFILSLEAQAPLTKIPSCSDVIVFIFRV